jgi:hypothetical protein
MWGPSASWDRFSCWAAIANQLAAMQRTPIDRSDPERRDDGGETPQP